MQLRPIFMRPSRSGVDSSIMAASARVGTAPPRRSDLHAPPALRARVFVRRGKLDGLLAAGADPSWDPELGLRARQISAPRSRRALAESIERAVWEAHRPPRWSCTAPLDRRAVRKATPELSALALELKVQPIPRAQGVALTTQLLRDPDSPLYAPGAEEALRTGALVARRALGEAVMSSSGPEQ
jgi:hypothetical protein